MLIELVWKRNLVIVSIEWSGMGQARRGREELKGYY
jgi:hypothetical protein